MTAKNRNIHTNETLQIHEEKYGEHHDTWDKIFSLNWLRMLFPPSCVKKHTLFIIIIIIILFFLYGWFDSWNILKEHVSFHSTEKIVASLNNQTTQRLLRKVSLFKNTYEMNLQNYIYILHYTFGRQTPGTREHHDTSLANHQVLYRHSSHHTTQQHYTLLYTDPSPPPPYTITQPP